MGGGLCCVAALRSASIRCVLCSECATVDSAWTQSRLQQLRSRFCARSSTGAGSAALLGLAGASARLLFVSSPEQKVWM